MATSDGGSKVNSSAGTCQQLGANLTIIPEEMTTVLEETVVTTATTDTNNEARPSGISMLHDYAMDYLFRFLPLADLKNCRLVNRYWNLVSNRAIQKRDYGIEFPNIPGARVVPAEMLDDVADIPKFVQQILTSFQFPWTKFLLNAHYITTAEAKHQLCNLLRAVSPFVTEIEIDDLHDLPSLEYPNLRKLDLQHDPNEEPKESNRESHLKLVESASKLTDIALTGPLATPLFMEMLEIPNCRKISRLTLLWWIEGEHLVKLSEMGLQLKYLYLVFQLPAVTAESLRAFLQSQSTYLEDLELLFDEFHQNDDEVDPRWRLGMEFPRMEKLKVLGITRVDLCSRISYKAMFPVLQVLTFYGNKSSQVNSFINDHIEPVETVEYVRFEDWLRYPERILQAGRQFPKLRRASVMVNRSHMNILGYAMPQLEGMELEFNRGDDIDAVLTGFSSEELETLQRLPSNQLEVLERSKEPVHFLKNLKKLILSSTLPREQLLPLTDFGCRFGLLKMGNLKVLELEGNFSQVSDQVMERMREKFVVRLEN